MKTGTARCTSCFKIIMQGIPHICGAPILQEDIDQYWAAEQTETAIKSLPLQYDELMKKEGIKKDDGKPRYDLIDSEALDEMAKVLTFGAKKYEANNWRKGISYSRIAAAILRHTFALLRGQILDPESGLYHSAHVQCNAMFLTWMIIHRKDMDDLYSVDRTEM